VLRWLGELPAQRVRCLGQQPGPPALRYLSPITTSILGVDQPAVTLTTASATARSTRNAHRSSERLRRRLPSQPRESPVTTLQQAHDRCAHSACAPRLVRRDGLMKEHQRRHQQGRRALAQRPARRSRQSLLRVNIEASRTQQARRPRRAPPVVRYLDAVSSGGYLVAADAVVQRCEPAASSGQ
jgi:hypothetical protein